MRLLFALLMIGTLAGCNAVVNAIDEIDTNGYTFRQKNPNIKYCPVQKGNTEVWEPCK